MKTTKLSKAILPLAICLFTNIAIAQPPTTERWSDKYDSGGTSQSDKGYAVTVDASNNSYITGFAKIGGDNKLVTRKINSAGTVQWTTVTDNVGTLCADEGGLDIIFDGTSVWVSGVTYAGTTDRQNLTLIRYNGSGVVQASYPKTFSDPGCACDNPANFSKGTTLTYYVDAINGLGIYIAGTSYDNTQSPASRFIVLKDNVGAAGWAWTYTASGTSTNTCSVNQANDIEVNATGVYATGFLTNTDKDIYTVELNRATGALINSATYSSGHGDDLGNVLEIDGSGNVYVGGYAGTASNGQDAFLVKYSSALASSWTATDGSTGTDSWTDMEVATSTVYVGGYEDRGSSTHTDYMLAAYTTGGSHAAGWSTNPVFYDGSKTGTEASGTDMGHGIEYSSSSGRVYITGSSDEGGSGASAVNITTIGYSATNGSKVWGAANYDESTDVNPNTGIDENYWKYGIEIAYDGNYCSDIIWVEGATKVTSPAQDLNYVTLNYSCPGTGCTVCGFREMNPNTPSKGIVEGFYPNPFSASADLILNSDVKDASLSVFDISGKLLIKIDNISSRSITINRGNLNTGIYSYKISENGTVIGNGKFFIAD